MKFYNDNVDLMRGKVPAIGRIPLFLLFLIYERKINNYRK